MSQIKICLLTPSPQLNIMGNALHFINITTQDAIFQVHLKTTTAKTHIIQSRYIVNLIAYKIFTMSHIPPYSMK